MTLINLSIYFSKFDKDWRRFIYVVEIYEKYVFSLQVLLPDAVISVYVTKIISA